MEATDLRAQVIAFLDQAENPVPRDIAINMVLQFLRDHLVSGGTPYLVDGAPMLLRSDGTLSLLTLENQEVCDFIHAAGLPLSGHWKQMLGDVLMTGGLPTMRLYGISLYVEESHLLFLNEWNGSYLCVDGKGHITRRKNGDDAFLFALGAQPHLTEIAEIGTSPRALAWREDDPLVRHVFGVGVYSETLGLHRQHAINLLLGWLLAVVMRERIRSLPIPFLTGPSGSKKTAVARACGQVICPEGVFFRVLACPNNAKDTENAIINAHGIIALDEFQKAQELSSLIKAVCTGAEIKRRILFTTSKERTYHVDATPFLTVNDDVWSDEATQKRLLRINMGQPSMATGGWRSEVCVERDWREQRLRDVCWDELVRRLAGVMKYLQLAKEAGRDDFPVAHRMSGYWSFLLSIAEQEGPEVLESMKASMAALDDTQRLATEASDDLLELLREVLSHSQNLRGRWISVSELRSNLDVHLGMQHLLPRGLRELIGSSFQLNRRLASNQAYAAKLGMKTRHHDRKVEYFFDPTVPLEAGPAKLQVELNVRPTEGAGS